MRVFCFIPLLLLFLSCKTKTSLKVATSANMQHAMNEIVLIFEQEYKISVDLIVSSSGKLATQIEQGAPFDIFVAADMKYPQNLYKKGLAEKPPEVYAKGNTVLWSLKNIVPSLHILTTDSVKKIAVANPKTAPYGELALSILKEKGIFEKVKHKLVYGESIAQTNQFINTKAVDIGFTALGVVLSDNIKTKGKWTIIDNEKNIPQGVVLLKKSSNQENSKKFYDFLFSKKAQVILKKYGYIIPKRK